MKSLICLLIATLLLASTAQARLGENRTQLIARYGQPEDLKSLPAGRLMFVKADLIITCVMSDDLTKRCVGIHYTPLEDLTHLSDTQIEVLLAANAEGPGYEWESAPNSDLTTRVWQTKGEELVAWYDGLDALLVVMTQEELKRQSEESKQKERDKLKGL